MWDEVGEVAKAEEVSKDLKFGIVDCHNNKPLCQEYGVNEKIQLKFFGKKNSWIGVQEFLESTIKDVLREDVLIEKFKKPGKLFVLFKVSRDSCCYLQIIIIYDKLQVVYCPYCKETMDEWIHVAEHFKNNKDVFVASIDCGRHREYCAQYDALKFPRIRFIYNTSGDKKVDFYDGERTAKDMIEFCESSLNRYK